MANQDFKKILIIKPGAIGDLLQLTPVIRGLKEKFPDARICLLVGSTSTADLFRYNTFVSEIIVFDKKGEHASFCSLVKLRHFLRQKKFDLVINFQRSNLKAWFLASAAFPCRVLVYHKARNRNIHAVVNHLETILPLGINVSNINLDLTTGPNDRLFAAEIISSLKNQNMPRIVLNPGATHRVNRWGTDHFARLADQLVEKFSANVIIIGGPDDVSLVDEIAKKTTANPLILAGKLTLLQLAALLERSTLLVTGDTGPMHMATAVGTRVVALFGAADPARTGPVGQGHKIIQASGVPCVPCRSRSCKNRNYLECMEKISVESIFEAIKEMLTPLSKSH